MSGARVQRRTVPRAGLNRRILGLAIPAFGALIAEPLLLLADTVIVSRLGTDPLAGVALATAVVQTAVGLMVFLAYSTTPAVAKHLGAGRMAEALAVGRDGLWLGALLGVLLAGAGAAGGRALLTAMGGQGAVLDQATTYLHWSLPGLPAMLMVTAGMGVLRGLQDTRTPLIIAAAGAVVNVGTNVLLVYGLGLGVAGAAMGTSATQWLMAAAFVVLLTVRSRRHGVGIGTTARRIGSLMGVGSWLMLRTVSLRAALLLTVVVVTAQGPENLAAYQLVMTIFNVMAYALDALAIAAQALVGKETGARRLTAAGQEGVDERAEVRHLTRRILVFGLWFGVVTGLVVGLLLPWTAPLLTPAEEVQSLFSVALLVVAVGQPLASWVFVLDGVLIGAGDARYLAVAGVINLIVYLPLLAAVHLAHLSSVTGLVWLWAAYAFGFMGARAVTLGLRAHGDRWLLRA
ncbi:MATE family efflux transporter [Kocuria coralli]|uniref:MATE family efflux transporter n=1 Tax=Kocuria coralli TaxID=1461025 RepID=A0A5J5KWT9_9MICC|nr:MATE family efflux transporter [Kocuria coralli]KAA9393271.1 MATE family efflux transporter [Kocuria coralli]